MTQRIHISSFCTNEQGEQDWLAATVARVIASSDDRDPTDSSQSYSRVRVSRESIRADLARTSTQPPADRADTGIDGPGLQGTGTSEGGSAQ
jgi:hypothetical protein